MIRLTILFLVLDMTGIFAPCVARFEICNNINCLGFNPDQRHLLVSTKDVALRKGAARAISYAWGQFDRQKRQIGHREDGQIVEMELGEDWDIPEFQHTLDRLCRASIEMDEYAQSPSTEYCWIDQICLKQDNPDQLREALQRIPDIYKTFEVFILMPGSRCTCLPELDRFTGSFDRGKDADNDTMLQDLKDRLCWGMLAVYGWSSRIWTRQEMLYARKMRIVWTSPTVAKCTEKKEALASSDELDVVLSVSNAQWSKNERLYTLESFERLRGGVTTGQEELPRTKLASHFSHNMGLSYHLVRLVTVALANVTMTLIHWINMSKLGENDGAINVADDEFDTMKNLFKFLNGEVMISPSWSTPDEAEATEDERGRQLYNFISDISQFATVRRHATKARDYVLAIWVDCPVYQIPRNYQEMSLGDLMVDAVQQLDAKAGIRLSTHLPAFLFGNKTLPHAWQPREHLNKQQVASTADVYGSLRHMANHFYAARADIKLPFHTVMYLESHGQVSNSFGLFQNVDVQRWLDTVVYERRSLGPNQLAAWRLLTDAVQNWKELFMRHCEDRMSQSIFNTRHDFSKGHDSPFEIWAFILARGENDRDHSSSEDQSETLAPLMPLVKQIISDTFNGAEDDVRSRAISSIGSCLSLNELAFKLTCCALGIDPATATATGLRLMLRDSPPMLGLTRRKLNRSWFSTPRRCMIAVARCEGGEFNHVDFQSPEIVMKAMSSIVLADHDMLLLECDLPQTHLFRYEDLSNKRSNGSEEGHLEDHFDADNLVGVWVPPKESVLKEQKLAGALFYEKCECDPAMTIRMGGNKRVNLQRETPAFFKFVRRDADKPDSSGD